MKRHCSRCGKGAESAWKLCPFCGGAIVDLVDPALAQFDLVAERLLESVMKQFEIPQPRVVEEGEDGTQGIIDAARENDWVEVERFLQAGADIDVAVGAAAAGGHKDLVFALLDIGADISPALIHARKGGHGELRLILEAMQEKGLHTKREARKVQQSLFDNLSLINAIKLHRLDIAERILAHDENEVKTLDMDWNEDDGNSALHVAARMGDIDAVKLLLRYPATRTVINWRPGKHSSTPLECVCGQDEDDDVLARLLLEAGADMNLSTRELGMQALHIAAERGHVKTVTLLLDHGAWVNQRTKKGYTALMLVANFEARYGPNLSHMCQLLLGRGADPIAVNRKGKSAIDLSRKYRGYVAQMIEEFVRRQPQRVELAACTDEVLVDQLKECLENQHATIGRGGFGTVYPFPALGGKDCVIKVVYAPEERFLDEVRVLHRVSHVSNVVKMERFFTVPTMAIVMEKAVYGSLNNVIEFVYSQKGEAFRATTFPCAALEILTQICQGMSDLHRHNVMHRDLKPRNVLVFSELRVKLCDFGISRVTDGTIHDTFAGTEGYTAPECRDKRIFQFASDVYSFGATTFVLVTNGKLDRVSAPPHEDIQEFGGDLKYEMQALVHRCCAVESESRPSFPSLLQNLQSLQESHPLPASERNQFCNELPKI